MNGAVVLIIVNAAVAAMFALGYYIVARINRGHRPVLAFAASYLIGMVTPLSELALRSTGLILFQATSYASLLMAFLVTAYAIARFEGRRPHWRALAIVGISGLVVRGLIWNGERDTLPYEIAFQAPLVVALGLCALAACRAARRRMLYHLLAGLFVVTAINFMAKPFVSHILGSGRTAQSYVESRYALFSQGSSGILLIAAGLLIFLIVLQTVVEEYTTISETDVLSGLLNRRGLDRRAGPLFDASERGGDVSLIMIDLDRFKDINDRHGHDVGDRTIEKFSALLTEAVPGSAIVARTGGEEFVVLLPDTGLSSASLVASLVKSRLAEADLADLPRFTFSAGVAQRHIGEGFAGLKRRADLATYRAKASGRDRIEIAKAGSLPTRPSSVTMIRSARER